MVVEILSFQTSPPLSTIVVVFSTAVVLLDVVRVIREDHLLVLREHVEILHNEQFFLLNNTNLVSQYYNVGITNGQLYDSGVLS